MSLTDPNNQTRNGMDRQIIDGTIQLWQQEPGKAMGNPVVKARTEGAQAILEAGPFSWRVDLPPSLGGRNEAPSPTALLLGALAGCAAVFIRDTLAPQLGVQVSEVQATAQCKSDARGLLGMEGAVPDLQDLELNIEIQSNDSQVKLEALFSAWQERCPIYLALLKPQQIRTTMSVRSGVPTMA